MSENFAWQAAVDEEHLKLLSLGYMISATTTALFSLAGLMYMAMGTFVAAIISHSPQASVKNGPPPAFIGWILGGMGLVFFVVAAALASAKLRAAFCIKRRKSRTFCLIVAGITCTGVPYGTVLGVLTFMVFGRESVARLFEAGAERTQKTERPL